MTMFFSAELVDLKLSDAQQQACNECYFYPSHARIFTNADPKHPDSYRIVFFFYSFSLRIRIMEIIFTINFNYV